MAWFIVAVLVALIGAAVAVKGKVTVDTGTKYNPETKEVSFRWVGAVILGFAVLILGFDSFTVVKPRNVAVSTSFGKVQDTMDSGPHLVAPWSAIEKFDASLQTLTLTGAKNDSGDPIKVRLASMATADLEVTMQWQIDQHADITNLYLDYRHFDKIEQNVVRARLRTTLNRVFESYDPFVALRMTELAKKDPTIKPVTMTDLEKATLQELELAMPQGIKVKTIQFGRPVFDKDTENRLAQLRTSLIDTQIAEQQKLTAEAQRQANDKLASGDLSWGVLFQNCLAMVERTARDGLSLPGAFSCGAPPTAVYPVK